MMYMYMYHYDIRFVDSHSEFLRLALTVTAQY